MLKEAKGPHGFLEAWFERIVDEATRQVHEIWAEETRQLKLGLITLKDASPPECHYHHEQDEGMWGGVCDGRRDRPSVSSRLSELGFYPSTSMSQSTVDCALTATNQFEYLLETLEDRNGSKPLVKEANLNQPRLFSQE
jgi:hypothetical protein